MTGCDDDVTSFGAVFLAVNIVIRNPFHKTVHIKIIILGLWFAKLASSGVMRNFCPFCLLSADGEINEKDFSNLVDECRGENV